MKKKENRSLEFDANQTESNGRQTTRHRLECTNLISPVESLIGSMLSTYHEFVTGVASFALSIVKGKNTAKMQPLKLNENKMSFCENFPFDIPSKWNFKLATV